MKYLNKSKLLTKASALSAMILTSAPVLALTDEQNAKITTAYDGTGASVNLIIGGLFSVVLLIAGFAIIYKLLNR